MEEEVEGTRFNIHPMDQFLVEPLFGDGPVHWYTPTNATLWMAIAVVGISLLMVFGARGRALIPSRAQSAAEVTYGFVHKMVTEGTLEERIDRMLEEKRELADQVVGSGEAWVTELDDDALRALVALATGEARR